MTPHNETPQLWGAGHTSKIFRGATYLAEPIFKHRDFWEKFANFHCSELYFRGKFFVISQKSPWKVFLSKQKPKLASLLYIAQLFLQHKLNIAKLYVISQLIWVSILIGIHQPVVKKFERICAKLLEYKILHDLIMELCKSKPSK